jgi:hypothetical protein
MVSVNVLLIDGNMGKDGHIRLTQDHQSSEGNEILSGLTQAQSYPNASAGVKTDGNANRKILVSQPGPMNARGTSGSSIPSQKINVIVS